MARNVQRQVRWNMKTRTREEEIEMRNEWYFFVLNTPQEIDRIKEKLIEYLWRCDNVSEIDNGILVPEGSLHGRLITFDSQQGRIQNHNKIYCSPNFRRDRELKLMDDVDFDIYCDKFRSF